MHLHQAADATLLAQDLARFVAERLSAGLAERGKALLIVSGGSTPLPFFKALAEFDLNWSQVTITLADDRWLPPDHADSNERTVRAALLQGLADQAKFVPLVTSDATPAQGHADVEAQLAAMPWPADVVILGMGGDGHTASLFPFTPELDAVLDAAYASSSVPVAAPHLPNVPVPRLSLTPRALLNAKVVVLHLTGASKWALMQLAEKPGAVAELPVRFVLHQNDVPVHVFYAM